MCACLVAHSTMDESQFRVVITALLTAFLAGYLTQSFAPQPPSQVSTSMHPVVCFAHHIPLSLSLNRDVAMWVKSRCQVEPADANEWPVLASCRIN